MLPLAVFLKFQARYMFDFVTLTIHRSPYAGKLSMYRNTSHQLLHGVGVRTSPLRPIYVSLFDIFNLKLTEGHDDSELAPPP